MLRAAGSGAAEPTPAAERPIANDEVDRNSLLSMGLLPSNLAGANAGVFRGLDFQARLSLKVKVVLLQRPREDKSIYRKRTVSENEAFKRPGTLHIRSPLTVWLP